MNSEAAAQAYCARFAGEDGMARLAKLAALLGAENQKQNLVSESSIAKIWERHLADSVQLLEHAGELSGLWLDLGTGAGFPGLAIAAVRPEMPVVLVESRKRRVDWLMRAAVSMDLNQCRVVGARLEDVQTFPAAHISARAFAPLGKLLSLSARFSTRDTTWLLPKGRSAAQELAEQPATVRAMFHVERSRTDTAAGILVGKGAPPLA